MKTEPDGFKIFEENDGYNSCINEMNNNTLLLRRQIQQLREEIEILHEQIDEMKKQQA